MQWSGSNKMISRILILNVFDYQFANCLRPNLTFIWGLVGYLEVSKILLAKQVEKILLRIVDFHHFIGLLEMVIPKYVRF